MISAGSSLRDSIKMQVTVINTQPSFASLLPPVIEVMALFDADGNLADGKAATEIIKSPKLVD